MEGSSFKVVLRYVISIFVICVFIFPIAWFALTSIKPISAVFNKDRVVVFDFKPTFENYQVTVLGGDRDDLSTGSSISMGTSGKGAYMVEGR